jgi:chemotaxis protein CheZ
MAVQRKVFRIEEGARWRARDGVAGNDTGSAECHREFMAAVQELRALVLPAAPADRSTLERARAQIAEAQAYKSELELIYAALEGTRDVNADAGADAFAGEHTARTARELHAIVAATEQATETILQAAEEIDRVIVALSASLNGEHAKGLAEHVQQRVVTIFEACNFQDLTGQRVGNVLTALKTIEHHAARLQSIWRNIETFKPVVLEAQDEHRYLNGPKLPDDPGHSSQADVDGMFGCG